MFKLFQNLLPGEANNKLNSAISESQIADWQTQIAQANTLWEQGKLSEALAIYGLVIEQNPDLPGIKQHLAERLKQQGDLALAYEKLATGLKNQGNVEQAANYYRQAINLKALTGNTKDQLLRGSVSQTRKLPIPIASLKEAAFSFQPLANSSVMIKVRSQSSISNVESESGGISPEFSQRLKVVNPAQAKDIDWETAQVYLQKALEHLERQEWQQSALACRQATGIMPGMAEAYKIWGNALQRMGKTSEAMSCYAKAVEIKPNLAEVYAGIANIYAQQARWQQAIKHYQKAIIIKPSAEIYRNLADVWQKLGESEKVEFNLYQATELELAQTSQTSSNKTEIKLDLTATDNSVEAYCRIAKRSEQLNQWKKAAKYYRQALDLSLSRPALLPQKLDLNLNKSIETKIFQQRPKPTHSNAKHTKLTTSESQLDKAIKRYHQQSKIQPNSPEIYTDLGNLYAKKGKLQYAIACYRKSIQLNRQYAKAHLNLGRVLFKVGKQQEFIKEMQLALALQPKIGTAFDHFYLGNALVDRGQQQKAVGFYCQAIDLNPQFSQSYHRLGEILSNQGKHREAIEFLEQGISHNPQDPKSYSILGQQWEMLQDWEKAVKTYSQLLELEPKFPEASQRLNHALAEKLKLNRQAKSQSGN